MSLLLVAMPRAPVLPWHLFLGPSSDARSPCTSLAPVPRRMSSQTKLLLITATVAVSDWVTNCTPLQKSSGVADIYMVPEDSALSRAFWRTFWWRHILAHFLVAALFGALLVAVVLFRGCRVSGALLVVTLFFCGAEFLAHFWSLVLAQKSEHKAQQEGQSKSEKKATKSAPETRHQKKKRPKVRRLTRHQKTSLLGFREALEPLPFFLTQC